MRARIVAVVAALLMVLTGCSAGSSSSSSTGLIGGDANAAWDPGFIFSDDVFYNPFTMTGAEIDSFLDGQGCTGGGCLSTGTYSWPAVSVDWCKPVRGGAGSFGVLLAAAAQACGINPQVVLTMIQKESQGLTRPAPAALTGFGCPDLPGGGPNCDSSDSGVWNQVWGMVQAFAHLKTDPSRINYPVGETSQILWNEAYTGCGTGPVTVRNLATASLYTYTPYQPNDASLAAYPGTGDKCSSYGNRNIFRMFQKYFGATGGGVASPEAVAPAGGGDTGAKIAQAALAYLGTPYVWGGGGVGGPSGIDSTDGRGPGFDCSGLVQYAIWKVTGQTVARTAAEQSVSVGVAVPPDLSKMQVGDLIGFDSGDRVPGADHIGIYIGNGQMVDAPESTTNVRIDSLTSGYYSDTSQWYVRRMVGGPDPQVQ